MRVFPVFAFFFEQAKIIAPLAKARLVSIVAFVRVHNLRVFQDFFLNHFYDAVFLSEQISVIHIRNLVNVKKSPLRLRRREHIVQIQNRKLPDFQKVNAFLHFLMLFLERRERHEIIQAVHRQHDADIFPRIFLPVLFVMKKVRRERHKVVDVQRIYLIKLNQSPLSKKTRATRAPAVTVLTCKAEIHLLIKFSLIEPRYTH